MQRSATEYNRTGIGSSEFIQQSTRMRIEPVVGRRETREVSS
jgi:hypothetical protein